MKKCYHILNGDALKERFPKQIKGEIIVARECFVDGSVKNNSLDELFQLRSKFISEQYGNVSIEDYYAHAVSEFEKIKTIPPQSEINLWFEDDLFCQVNFWFVAHLISNFIQKPAVFLIRPSFKNPYSFGSLQQSELIEVFQEKILIKEIDKIASLWDAYQKAETEKLLEKAKALKKSFSFIHKAVKAHIARIPNQDDPGRPIQALIKIMNELNTNEFAPIFKAFNKQEAIYGFGDLQVKRLLYEIKKHRIELKFKKN